MKDFSRRKMLKLSVLGGLGSIGIKHGLARAMALMPTPSETEGPFYPVTSQSDKDADLTHILGKKSKAMGQHIVVQGQIREVNGKPVAHALLDIWQADANGRYRHPGDSSSAKLDENFQGQAVINSDQAGFFRFITVMPGAYPANKDWIRPPHIHFKISKAGLRPLTTQMYFPDQTLNQSDWLLRSKSTTERLAMVARHAGLEGNLPIYEYNIVLDLLD